MTKDDILKLAGKFKLSYDITYLEGIEYILFGDPDGKYVRMMFYKGKWYGCHNGKVPKGSVDIEWVKNALKDIAK